MDKFLRVPVCGDALGRYWTTIKPTGPLQAQFDFALKPEWGNTANRVVAVRVPAGQVIYQGVADAQGVLTGVGIQASSIQ